MLKELTGVIIESSQVLLGNPIKEIGIFDTEIALHPDVVVPIKVYVAQTQDEIDALVAGKVLTYGIKKAEDEEITPESENTEKSEESENRKKLKAQKIRTRKKTSRKPAKVKKRKQKNRRIKIAPSRRDFVIMQL